MATINMGCRDFLKCLLVRRIKGDIEELFQKLEDEASFILSKDERLEILQKVINRLQKEYELV